MINFSKATSSQTISL